MKKIKYIAYTKDNKRIYGEEYVENDEDLYDILNKKSLFLSEVKEGIDVYEGFERLNNKTLNSFCRQLGVMLDSGIPIAQALSILSEVISGNRKAKKICEFLGEKVQKGYSISSCMQETNAFPDMLINVVKVGEENGTLSTSLINMAEYYDNASKIGNKIFVAMIYPSMLVVGALIAIVAIFNFILPNLLSSIESLTELPPITKIVMNISRLITTHGLFLLLSIAFVICIIALIFRTKPVKYYWSRFKIRIPYIGKLLKTLYTSRFSSSFSSLYSSGVPIPRALILSSNTINNFYIEEQIINTINKINAGISLSSVLNEIEGFDRKLTANIEVGEKTGRIEDMLIPLSKSLSEEANKSMDILIAIIEPLSIIVIGLMMLPLMLSVVMPMMSLYSSFG